MSRYILILIGCINIFFSCKNQTDAESEIDETKQETIVFDGKNSPFNESTKIEVLNYWFQVERGDSTFLNYPRGAAFNYYPEIVDKKVILDSLQTNELYEILYADIVEIAGPADCYMPHHSILFYKENEVIFDFHVCLSCDNYQKSKNFDFPYFDDDKWCELRFFFEKIGLRTIYDTNDEYACGRKPLTE